MMVVNLVGGLGNQMFQYACARSASLRLGTPLAAATDMFASYGSAVNFELQQVFGLQLPAWDTRRLAGLLGPVHAAVPVRRLLARPALRPLASRRMFVEPHFQYWTGLHEGLREGPAAYLQGYWQSARYFEDHAAAIRQDLRFRRPLGPQDRAVLEQMRQQPSAAVHVRRGDYTSAKNAAVYAALDAGYYRRAMARLAAEVPGLRFFVFSDDPDWARAQFAADGAVVVSHNRGADSSNDMHLMSLADHNIIANSTFSWWSAWLNTRPQRQVIAPQAWFVSPHMDTTDLYPAGWIRM